MSYTSLSVVLIFLKTNFIDLTFSLVCHLDVDCQNLVYKTIIARMIRITLKSNLTELFEGLLKVCKAVYFV